MGRSQAADRQDNRQPAEAPNRPSEPEAGSTVPTSPQRETTGGVDREILRLLEEAVGPGGGAIGLADAERQARKLARSHYENFLVASALLPRRLRQPFYNVYAFCRAADDLADESGSPAEALQRLDALSSQLDRAFDGEARAPLMVALTDTVQRFDLPRQPFDDLIDAFRQDQRKRRYETFEELLEYCRRSANPVGRIVLRLAGCFDESRASLSDQICTGLQLANFWQDLARDYANGRIYLPADEMRQYQVVEPMLAARTTASPFRDLLRFQCDRAETYFRRGLPLADRVPPWLAGDVRLFAHGGLQTLEAIRRGGYDVLRRRPTVSRVRKLWMLTLAAVGRL